MPTAIPITAIPSSTRFPTDDAALKEYAAERRKLITEQASLEFRPGKIGDKPRSIRSSPRSQRYKIPDALMAKDTTCVDAIDKDGIVFSATPSGAWMPTYLPATPAFRLTQRAQSFLLVPGHPNELAPGKRPRVTLSPDPGHCSRQDADRTLHARRRQSGSVAAAGAVSLDLLRHECAGRGGSAALPDASTWYRASTITP